MELVVESSEQDNHSLVQLQCMQELPRQYLGFYQKFKQENEVGSKMKQLELQPQGKIAMNNFSIFQPDFNVEISPKNSKKHPVA